MFSQITKNWRGRPLETLEIIVNLIAATTTTKGLKINCELDTNVYSKGIQISDEEYAMLRLRYEDTLPQWNYTLCPKTAH